MVVAWTAFVFGVDVKREKLLGITSQAPIILDPSVHQIKMSISG
jgi:hypothetical protein